MHDLWNGPIDQTYPLDSVGVASKSIHRGKNVVLTQFTRGGFVTCQKICKKILKDSRYRAMEDYLFCSSGHSTNKMLLMTKMFQP